MNNDTIADNFSLLAKLMDIHGENPFKSKSYANAAFQIDKLTVPLAGLSEHQIAGLKGIGETIAQKIIEQLSTGSLAILNEYLEKTPSGILDMLRIKGIGPKKIATIWKELEIESLGELLYACNENRLTLYKGFGEKTQQNIKDAIEFYLKHQGLFLFAELENWVMQFEKQLQIAFPEYLSKIVGDYVRQMEIIHQIQIITTIPTEKITAFLTKLSFTILPSQSKNIILANSADSIQVQLQITDTNQYYQDVFRNSASDEFISYWEKLNGPIHSSDYQSEEDIFKKANIHYIPPAQRESIEIIDKAKVAPLTPVIQQHEIKGIIHSHSNWSDGMHTLEEMAIAAKQKNLEYLVISDHSRSAFYANGLHPDRILAQHAAIEKLNKALAPFTIFKSIESDILNEGALDYPEEVLNSFDLVIASIHSNLKMQKEKAMARLLKAIENPFTTILGHLTGRLLLSRAGYPIDHEIVIDACVQHQVAIELNAHPRRLDLDWRWIDKAIKKGALLSINPDAHAIEGFADIRYGIMVAQKAGLTAANNLSSFTLLQFQQFIDRQKQKRSTTH